MLGFWKDELQKKVIDPDLPAPQEKMVFSHLSSDQNEIKEEVKRTFQKINAKQAKQYKQYNRLP